MDIQATQRIQKWLTGAYDTATRAAVEALVRDHPQEAQDAFYQDLSFGTGGMRGIMGIGTNRMNIYTVRAATQGFATYLQQTHLAEQETPSVFIGYDSRHNSFLFAQEAAKVLLGNGIVVWLFPHLRPTPLVSFGCRFKKCSGALMITASHNPPEYNGYKVYGPDGGQVSAPEDTKIINEVRKIQDPTQVQAAESLDHPLFHWALEEVDQAYLAAIETLALYRQENKASGNNLSIAYTSLHGTGITMVPAALQRWGFHQLHLVHSQITPDGDFPDAAKPNPEEPAALKAGIEVLEEKKADILLATDPDADRLGVVVRHKGASIILTGNQIASLCVAHICKTLFERQQLFDNIAFVKTVVTTELIKAITDHYNTHCFDVLTGFKYIATLIRQWESGGENWHFMFGAEESYGFLLGSFSRDKDAIVSSALLAEIALLAKQKGKTLIDLLHGLYQEYGIHIDRQRSVTYSEGQAGHEAMLQAMIDLRQKPFTHLEGLALIAIDDYLTSTHLELASNSTTPLQLPKTDLITYWLEGGTKLMIRPSGTEPKIKIYCGVVLKNFDSLEEGMATAKKTADALLNSLLQNP